MTAAQKFGSHQRNHLCHAHTKTKISEVENSKYLELGYDGGMEEKKPRFWAINRTALRAIVVLAITPLLYVLSVGPAAWLMMSGYLPQEWYMRIYGPLSWLAVYYPKFESAISLYLRMWVN